MNPQNENICRDHGERLARLEIGGESISDNTRSIQQVWSRIGSLNTRMGIMESQMREIRVVGRAILLLVLSAVVLQVLAMAGIVGGGR